jgi:hypothetical protein
MYLFQAFKPNPNTGGRLLKAALNFARSEGIGHATLHASQSGRSLYEFFGFRDTNEMRLAL